MKRPGAWITERLNKQSFNGHASNDDAFESQRRCGALAVERVYLDHEPRVQSHFDDEREQEGR